MKLKYTLSFLLVLGFASCKKLIQIPPPVGTITAPQVYSTDDQATSAVAGIYYQMINSGNSFVNYSVSLFTGMSADELIPFDQNGNDPYIQFRTNQLNQQNDLVTANLWDSPYSTIYQTNAVIEGLQGYNGVHDAVKVQLTAQAEFVRAFTNFYLVNLFGNVPLVNTINWRKTNLLYRTSADQVNEAIIADLIDAQSKLPTDYSAGDGQRIIPNKWACTAMLARMYLYQKQWAKAEEQATAIINNNALFGFTDSLNQVFLINSKEAIWQLQQSNQGNSYNGTQEGVYIIPLDSTYAPQVYLTTTLHNAFEKGDKRFKSWVDSTNYNGVKYYFPYKYKVGPKQIVPGGSYTEYYMVLRLAEQYLIRAEARANLGKLGEAAADINAIRNRAGLANTKASGETSLLDAIAHERQVELFAEWGHRWLDLKRTATATGVLTADKGFQVSTNDLLYPIPLTNLVVDPNLTQNSGY